MRSFAAGVKEAKLMHTPILVRTASQDAFVGMDWCGGSGMLNRSIGPSKKTILPFIRSMRVGWDRFLG